MTPLRLVLAAGATLIASGCSEYLKRIDAVTDSGGNADAINTAIHVRNPWPRHVHDRRIEMSGEKAAAAVERYRTGQRSEPQPATVTAPAPGTAPAPAPPR